MTVDPQNPQHLWLIDSHVHIYQCFQPGEFFTAAHRNLETAAIRLGRPTSFTGVLLLTECQGDDVFERLRQQAAGTEELTRSRWQGWRFATVPDDPLSLVAENDEKHRLLVVAGRQIVTAEKLEVLALLTDARFADGLPVTECLARVSDCGAVPVIPWGAGKWWGRRGRLLSQLLDTRWMPFDLGDNGGRPTLWMAPRHFQEARRLGVRLLPGSDPLPLPWDAQRVGSRGFAFTAPKTVPVPSTMIRDSLRNPNLALSHFGKPLGNARFLVNQVALRLRTRQSLQFMVST